MNGRKSRELRKQARMIVDQYGLTRDFKIVYRTLKKRYARYGA